MDNSLLNQNQNLPGNNVSTLKRRDFENKYDPSSAGDGGGDCEDSGTCGKDGGLGKNKDYDGQNSHRLNTYRNYQQAQLGLEASHMNYTASTATSQSAPSGSAFDTTLNRYSPNVAQVINF